MANQNSDKRVNMNITMNIELKNSGSGKDYQKIVEAVTTNAMACIDAALAPTNLINNEMPTDTKEMAKLRRSLDNKNSKNSKNEKGNATSSNTTSTVSSRTKKAETSKKEGKVTDIETDKRVETEAMKKVRQSLELKNLKKNKNGNPNATSSRCGNVAGTTNYSKEANNTIPKEGKDKPAVETEAMKKIRLSLELKNKSKENNATPSTSSLTNSTRTCQRVEGTGNTKSPGKGTKRKVADMDKTQIDTEGGKRRKGRNSGRNEYCSKTINTTTEITNEPMDISDDTDDENAAAPSVTGGLKNTTQETKRVTVKAGIETEAMRLIRSRLELKKTKNKNDVASYSTNTTSPPSATRVVKEAEKVKSPKVVKRNTAVDNLTDEIKRMKERIQQRNTPQMNETSRNTNTTYAKTGHESDPTYNISPCYTYEITEDESDDNSAVYPDKNSGTTNTDENKANKCQSSSTSDVEQPDNTPATTIRRVTRSKTWERRAWTK